MSFAQEEKLASQNTVAFVACNGTAAGQKRFAGCASCKEAVESGFARGECKSGCVGVGSCIEVCKQKAMSLVDVSSSTEKSATAAVTARKRTSVHRG